MPQVYGQMTKIPNAVGRSNYINDTERQEEIVTHIERMEHTWAEHHDFEVAHANADKTNNDAREIIVALPNELYGNQFQLTAVCMSIADRILEGKNNDYEIAVHWNHARTNLHMHFIFSERENATDREPKVYAKDIWQDKDTHKLAKANAPNAELVHRKGEVQRDKEGNIKYKDEPFKAKDRRFAERGFIQRKNEVISEVFKQYGFDIGVQNKDTPYLSQRKEYKGASADYIKNCKDYNRAVRKYNDAVKDHLRIEPQREPTYIEQRNKIESAVKSENHKERKIANGAIKIIYRMANVIRQVVNKLTSRHKGEVMTDNFNSWYELNQTPLLNQLQKVSQSDANVALANNLVEVADKDVAEKQAIYNEALKLHQEEQMRKAEEEKRRAEEQARQRAEQERQRKLEEQVTKEYLADQEELKKNPYDLFADSKRLSVKERIQLIEQRQKQDQRPKPKPKNRDRGISR